MLWFFQRGEEYLRIETTYDWRSGEFALIVDKADGTQKTETFADQAAFEQRLATMERQLVADNWRAKGSTVLPTRPKRPN